MNCPKCNGGSFVSEEELVQVMDGEPARLLLKATFSCRACNERFSRLVWDDLGHHRRVELGPPQPPGVLQPQIQSQEQSYYQPSGPPPSYQAPAQQKKEEEIAEGLRFF